MVTYKSAIDFENLFLSSLDNFLISIVERILSNFFVHHVTY